MQYIIYAKHTGKCSFLIFSNRVYVARYPLLGNGLRFRKKKKTTEEYVQLYFRTFLKHLLTVYIFPPSLCKMN